MVLWKMIKIEELMKSQYQSGIVVLWKMMKIEPIPIQSPWHEAGALPQVKITLQEPMTSNGQYSTTFKQGIVVSWNKHISWPVAKDNNIQTYHSPNYTSKATS